MTNKALVFTIANALLFQAGWFVCILCGSFWAGIFTLAAIIFHFVISRQRRDDAVALLIAIALGLVHDSLLLHGGHIRFVESAYLPPLWLVCLWALLGITLNHSLVWIYSRPLWSALLGAIAAPLSYLAGVSLSSAEWSSPLVEVLPIIAILWLVVLPLHRFLSLRVLSYVQRKTTGLSSSHSRS
jgi:hypothetical protein